MKTLILNPKSIKSLLVISGVIICMSSCKKDSTTTDTTLTDDEVAESVTESVSGGSGGLATQTETSTVIVSNTALSCGYSSDTTISGQSAGAAAVTYNYSLAFSRSLMCNFAIPSEFDFTFTGQSSYTTLRMSSDDNSTATFKVTGLEPSAANYVLNENYVRNGTQQSSVRLKRSFSSTITITATDITVEKATEKIISGTATVQFTGAVTGGASTTRGGTITFLGGSKATLVLDNGSTYSIQW
jgi:hypothetical protein